MACNDAMQSILIGNPTFRIVLGALLYHWGADTRSHIRCTITPTVIRDSCLSGMLYNIQLTYVFRPARRIAKEGALFVLMRMQCAAKCFNLTIGIPCAECAGSSKLMHGTVKWSDMKARGLFMLISDAGYVSFMYKGRLHYCHE